MAKVKVAIELFDAEGVATMRWEQFSSTEAMGAFVLLGRAFELAQRDTGASFSDAFRALLAGASIQKGDVAEAIQRLADQ